MSEIPTVQPMFYDALNGEFIPKDGVNKGINSLGRLAFISFQSGERVRNGRAIDSRYRPSWADIIVESTWSEQPAGTIIPMTWIEDKDLSRTMLINVNMFNRFNDWLSIVDRGNALDLATNSGIRNLSLEPQDGLDRTKRIVTAAAQSFIFEASR